MRQGPVRALVSAGERSWQFFPSRYLFEFKFLLVHARDRC